MDFNTFANAHPVLTAFGVMFGMILFVALGAMSTTLRLAPWVYRSGVSFRCFARLGGQRLYKGRYLLWSPVVAIIPGLLYFTFGQSFYLDDYGFNRLWFSRNNKNEPYPDPLSEVC